MAFYERTGIPTDPPRDRRHCQRTIRVAYARIKGAEQRIVLAARNVYLNIATRHNSRSQSTTRFSGPRINVGADVNTISVYAARVGEQAITREVTAIVGPEQFH
jgi:hypothetical protein